MVLEILNQFSCIYKKDFLKTILLSFFFKVQNPVPMLHMTTSPHGRGIYIIPIYYAFRIHIVVVFNWCQNNPTIIATRDKVTAVAIVLVVASLPTVRRSRVMVRVRRVHGYGLGCE